MQNNIMKHSAGLIASVGIAVYAMVANTHPLIALAGIVLGLFTAGILSKVIFDEVLAVRQSVQTSAPEAGQAEYQEGLPTRVTVNDGATPAEINQAIKEKAQALGGTAHKSGDRKVILVRNMIRPVEVIYQQVDASPAMIQASEPTPNFVSTSPTKPDVFKY